MFIFVQFTHCLIYMKRGGKMQEEIEKNSDRNFDEKSNRKIHIIFAIFTLILSFGISFIDVSAVSYEKTLTVEQFNKYIAEYPYYTKTYGKSDIFYNSTYYFSKTKIRYENNQIITEDGSSFLRVKAYVTKDEPDSFQFKSEFRESGTSYNNSYPHSFVHSNYDVYEDGLLIYSSNPEDFPVPPVGIFATTLPEVVTLNSQIIIGGTICFLALMIFLVILVRHFRTVSQGY